MIPAPLDLAPAKPAALSISTEGRELISVAFLRDGDRPVCPVSSGEIPPLDCCDGGEGPDVGARVGDVTYIRHG